MSEILDYSRSWQQFATFPCWGNTKIPYTKNGYKDAQVGQNVQSFIDYGYNAALACATSGLIMIDCDVDETKGYNGLETLKTMEAERGKLPGTLTQKTPRGGKHFIFNSKGISSPRGKIGKDIDVKYNGYIMIAPSAINGRSYEVIDGVDENGGFIIADLTVDWVDYLNKGNKTEPQASQQTKAQRKLYTGVDIELMFKKCAFLAYCAGEENASCLPEPMWHTMVTVLSQIEGTEELIHQLSEPHSNYSFKETEQKIKYAKEFGHSQSCEYISSNYPVICKNCSSAVSERQV